MGGHIRPLAVCALAGPIAVSAHLAWAQENQAGDFAFCASELSIYRDLSSEVWLAGQTASSAGDQSGLLERQWERAQDQSNRTSDVMRDVVTLLYSDLNNLIKDKFVPFVDEETIDATGAVIRCVKQQFINTGDVEARDSTAGLDLFFARRIDEAFGLSIDLGEPL